MEHVTDSTGGNAEIMNFIASRFLNYKRIDHEIFLELLNENFPGQFPESYIQSLIDEKILKTYNGHLVVLKEEELKGLVFGQPQDQRRGGLQK